MIYAAGILIADKTGRVLFLKRGPGGDAPGAWCFPGGQLEEGEDALTAAVRETQEEAGYKAKAKDLIPWSRTVTRQGSYLIAAPTTPKPADAVEPGPADDVDFETFALSGVDEFVPVLGPEKSPEHVAYAWAPPDQPPEPLHPGCRIALAKLTMDELGLARAIMMGELTSPQRYKNVWLFDLRITGTGVAYRAEKKNDKDEIVQEEEFVYRRPENYLNPEFLARCNGLPVIMMHPGRGEMDSKEFSDRIVGTMMLPYIGDGVRHPADEVWGISKVYDDDAAKLMTERQLSTSPMVILRGRGDTKKMTLEDGKTLVIEGSVSLLDHLAICTRGVWDKGGDNPGVQVDGLARSDSMADEKKAEEAKADTAAEEKKEDKKGDADFGEKLDTVLKGIDALSKRMDSFEEDKKKRDAENEKVAEEDKVADKKKDAEEEKDEKKSDKKKDVSEEEKVADKKKDAEEEKDEKKKSDSTIAEAVAAAVSPLTKRIEEIASSIPKQLSDQDLDAMSGAQARADDVYSMFGQRAPRPLDGENLLSYRKRLVEGLREKSERWKKVALTALGAEAFGVAEEQVYADATATALNPVDLPDGEMRQIVSIDDTGRRITSFRGRPVWMRDFAAPKRRLAGIRKSA